ncbi:hypothetical protein Sps_04512 [Shewanella psychrophila]|uniref:Uncharacterized protein n=1 Tax=Shewanella psychrophila TaxID=225848 RepID=A0A1S6HVK7_9GAMM|nr:hypothetical protein [Shewanella psychrophila]AQS39597.1 hypothetical protein Sps_04512 [Shewanella psychrophila]
MAKRNRSTLKNYFRKGALPQTEHFSDLIDSCLNTLEKGFDKSVNEGFKISSLEENANLLSFYRDSEPEQVLWSIKFDQEIDSLLFKAPEKQTLASGQVSGKPAPSALCISPHGRLGINQDKPMHALDVNGMIQASGRLGNAFEEQNGPGTVKADGQWHNITPVLEGVQAFEVTAGVGIKRTGRYAMLRAIAMNTCNPSRLWFDLFNWFTFKKPIKCQHAYYSSSSDKLAIRWVNAPQSKEGSSAYRPYYLQVKSNTDYGGGVNICFHITKLWADEYMQECHEAQAEVSHEQ